MAADDVSASGGATDFPIDADDVGASGGATDFPIAADDDIVAGEDAVAGIEVSATEVLATSNDWS